MLDLVFEPQPPPREPEREVCVWRDEQGTVFARAFARGTRRWIDWPGLGVFAFGAGSATVHVWPAADRAIVANAFARVVQPIILQALGRQALHASGVLGAGGVLAFCGVGRSGKSTLAFALAEAGFRQIADDALVIERDAGAVTTRFLPFVPGLREPSRRHFGNRAASASRASIDPLTADGRTAPLRGILVLRQDEAVVVPEAPIRMPAVQAFAALVTHARCFDETDAAHTRQLVEDYLAIAEDVPVFALRYPPHFGRLNDLIAFVIETGRTVGVVPFSIPRPVAVLP